VTGVRRGEPAEEAGVKDDDVIVRVGTRDVENVADLRRKYDASVEAKQERVLLKVRRGRGVVPVLLKIDYRDEPAKKEGGAPEKNPGPNPPPTPDAKKAKKPR